MPSSLITRGSSWHVIVDVLDAEARRAVELHVDVATVELDLADRAAALEHRSVVLRSLGIDQRPAGRWRQGENDRRGGRFRRDVLADLDLGPRRLLPGGQLCGGARAG